MSDSNPPEIAVIGGGLAGVDAAWQAARAGARVRLYEMRPVRKTPAHKTDRLAELVCSNSLKSNQAHTAPGMLKVEMRLLGSLVIAAADESAVPAGAALAVDREQFAARITSALEEHPRITVLREEVTEIPDAAPTVICTGPLTSDALAARIQAVTGSEALYFYDAASPILEAESINREIIWEQSRYDKGGGGGYLNCPFDEIGYYRFREALIAAELTPLHDFEPMKMFEGCLPIEELARRGPLTMAYGPMRPVGLRDPRTGERPFAVVQLRAENRDRTLWSMVGYQTRLKWPEQKRIFRTIPGLEEAEFVRLGVMHRNTYLRSPTLLEPTLALRPALMKGAERRQPLFFAGQMTGVEGYVESAATGMLAGLNAARMARGKAPLTLPAETMLGALAEYVSHGPADNFQPLNSNFGLLPALHPRVRRKAERRAAMAARAIAAMREFCAALGRGEPAEAAA